jgi:hypothetical protein
MTNGDLETIENTLKQIQNIGIMLGGASEYVCEDGVLKRFSRYLETYTKTLETDVRTLKKRFPGRFPNTPRVDSSLSRIRDISKSMRGGKKPDAEAECRAGGLGHELTAEIVELRGGVQDIWDTVSGKVKGYTVADRIAGQGGKVTAALYYLSPFAPIPRKIILAVIILVLIGFGGLYFTMESETALVQGIKDDMAYLETNKEELAGKMQEYEKTAAEIKMLEKKNLSRKEKIRLLNLSVEEGKLSEFIEKTKVLIEKRERELAIKKGRLEELRSKSFFQKLLRR